ncbi:MAG: hypothetical protein ACTSUK_07610, partial [Promethearchaeota archaeon]
RRFSRRQPAAVGIAPFLFTGNNSITGKNPGRRPGSFLQCPPVPGTNFGFQPAVLRNRVSVAQPDYCPVGVCGKGAVEIKECYSVAQKDKT